MGCDSGHDLTIGSKMRRFWPKKPVLWPNSALTCPIFRSRIAGIANGRLDIEDPEPAQAARVIARGSPGKVIDVDRLRWQTSREHVSRERDEPPGVPGPTWRCARGMRPETPLTASCPGSAGLVPRRSDGGRPSHREEAVCATETSIQAF